MTCARKDKACHYAEANRGANSPAIERATTESSAVTITPQPLSVAQEETERPSDPASDHAHNGHTEITGLHWPASGAGVATLPNPDLLDHSSANDLVSIYSPAASQHNYLSPSNASFAAVQWFGLLASDAARESPHRTNNPHFCSTQILPFDHSGVEGADRPSPLQRVTQVLDNPPAGNAVHGSDATDEERIWQSPKSIDLLPAEQTLFEHFLHQVCPWIGGITHFIDVID